VIDEYLSFQDCSRLIFTPDHETCLKGRLARRPRLDWAHQPILAIAYGTQ
jgi:hypothetical protein